MKTHLYKFFLIYLFLQGMCAPFLRAATQENIFFNTLTTDDGLSQFTAQALYADERGQIWIGTRNGLSVYNGARVKSYKQEKGNTRTLLGRKIRNICGNGKGIIYIYCLERDSVSSTCVQKSSNICQTTVLKSGFILYFIILLVR